MISTVTTSTISTITSVTTTIGFGVIIGMVAVVTLLVFLCTSELAAFSQDSKYRVLAKSLDIVIAPLFIAFTLIAAMKIVEILA